MGTSLYLLAWGIDPEQPRALPKHRADPCLLHRCGILLVLTLMGLLRHATATPEALIKMDRTEAISLDEGNSAEGLPEGRTSAWFGAAHAPALGMGNYLGENDGISKGASDTDSSAINKAAGHKTYSGSKSVMPGMVITLASLVAGGHCTTRWNKISDKRLGWHSHCGQLQQPAMYSVVAGGRGYVGLGMATDKYGGFAKVMHGLTDVNMMKVYDVEGKKNVVALKTKAGGKFCRQDKTQIKCDADKVEKDSEFDVVCLRNCDGALAGMSEKWNRDSKDWLEKDAERHTQDDVIIQKSNVKIAELKAQAKEDSLEAGTSAEQAVHFQKLSKVHGAAMAAAMMAAEKTVRQGKQAIEDAMEQATRAKEKKELMEKSLQKMIMIQKGGGSPDAIANAASRTKEIEKKVKEADEAQKVAQKIADKMKEMSNKDKANSAMLKLKAQQEMEQANEYNLKRDSHQAKAAKYMKQIQEQEAATAKHLQHADDMKVKSSDILRRLSAHKTHSGLINKENKALEVRIAVLEAGMEAEKDNIAAKRQLEKTAVDVKGLSRAEIVAFNSEKVASAAEMALEHMKYTNNDRTGLLKIEGDKAIEKQQGLFKELTLKAKVQDWKVRKNPNLGAKYSEAKAKLSVKKAMSLDQAAVKRQKAMIEKHKENRSKAAKAKEIKRKSQPSHMRSVHYEVLMPGYRDVEDNVKHGMFEQTSNSSPKNVQDAHAGYSMRIVDGAKNIEGISSVQESTDLGDYKTMPAAGDLSISDEKKGGQGQW